MASMLVSRPPSDEWWHFGVRVQVGQALVGPHCRKSSQCLGRQPRVGCGGTQNNGGDARYEWQPQRTVSRCHGVAGVM